MPDLTFFPDPNVDRVLGVVMELAAEVYALRERLHTVERLLERAGAVLEKAKACTPDAPKLQEPLTVEGASPPATLKENELALELKKRLQALAARVAASASNDCAVNRAGAG